MTTDVKNDSLKLENQICFPLYAASREVVKLYRPFLEELDLTYTQYIAMMVFWEQKKINVKELGKRLYLDSGTLTPVLKSIEHKGYVKRARSTDDERVLIVEITEAGEALKQRAEGIPAKVSEQLGLTDAEADILYDTLYKVLSVVTEK
nr:MarR family transcriptional regulator [Clostridia bacterium]